MATVLDLITEAMKQIGALAIGETPTAEEAQDALAVLNDMLDSWRTESLLVDSYTANLFDFTAGQAAYTVGTGGNFNMSRPVTIDAVYVRDTQGNDYQVTVTNNYDDYASVVSKTVSTSIPQLAYDDGSFPLRTLTFWPVPSDTTYRPVLWTRNTLTQYNAITDVLSLAPGYKAAIQTNLALALCPRYGVTNTTNIEKDALKYKAAVKRINNVVPSMTMPADLQSAGRWFNYLTGQPS